MTDDRDYKRIIIQCKVWVYDSPPGVMVAVGAGARTGYENSQKHDFSSR